MPVSELIRYFNAADHAGDSTLYSDGERVAAWHNGLRLGSLFQPIVDLQQAQIVGHQATLSARREDGSPLSSAAAYALCETPAAVVHFDRLSRTLHTLNFLAQRRYAGGYLQLAVHPRHLQAVQNQHGLVYEAILKRCGLGPADIVLEIATSQGDYSPHLAVALNSYRQRGYRLAIADFSTTTEPAGLLVLQPDILKLRLDAAGQLPGAGGRDGIVYQLTGIESGDDLALARAAGADLGQGGLFGPPRIDCRPTHSKRRVAYNSLSSFGVET